MRNKYKISLADYERIFRTVHCFITRYQFPNPHKDCTFFSVIGAAILNIAHGVKARSVSGAVAFNFDLDRHICFSTGIENGVLACADSGFHSWVEAEGWFIDFTSPMLPEIVAEANLKTTYRKMFQRPLSEEAKSPFELSSENRFYLSENLEFSKKRIDFVLDNPLYSKITGECIEAYLNGRIPCESKFQIRGMW